ncbi:MAG: tetratricopeptide repeat protein [Polyangiaceae bacterium]
MADPNLERLIGVLQDSLLLNGRDVWRRTQLGETFHKLGKLDEARGAFQRALKDDPAYAPAHAALGKLFADEDRWPEAETSLRHALQLKPDLVDAFVTLADGYARRADYARASEAYASALALKPEMVSLLRGAAKVAVASKRHEDAARFFGMARQEAPDDPDVLLGLGLALGELSRHAEAREALRAYTAKRDGPIEAW